MTVRAAGPTDDLAGVRAVADAVLYEGYLLYPYRASSAKNQVRWQFGVLGPAGAAAAGTGEDPALHVECLLDGPARVDLLLRFLHPQWRAVEQADGAGGFAAVDELSVGGARWIGWHEAVEHEHTLNDLAVDGDGLSVDVAVPGGTEVELLRDGSGRVVGRLVRTRWPLTARLDLGVTAAAGSNRLRQLAVTVTNTATWQAEGAGGSPRDRAARRSLVGAHLVLRARGGLFVSIVDPPAYAAAAARDCRGSRCWPVLAGAHDAVDAQRSDIVLAAPIILPEHPTIAAESPGDLFDATEIDEILTLRVMTMTDEEKQAARGTDPRAAAIIDRCDGMPPEVFERLHGALRGYGISGPGPDGGEIPTFVTPAAPAPADHGDGTAFDTAGAPWWDPAQDAAVSPGTDAVLVAGVPVTAGSRVRLRPSRRADAQDLFLAGMAATVRAVLADVDGSSHVAVTLDDDPASDLHHWYGRYYYFAPDELVLMPDWATS